MHSPGFDMALPLGVDMHRSAVASSARGRAAFSADACDFVPQLRRMRVRGLMDDLGTVRVLHGVIPVAVEDDDRHSACNLATRCLR